MSHEVRVHHGNMVSRGLWRTLRWKRMINVSLYDGWWQNNSSLIFFILVSRSFATCPRVGYQFLDWISVFAIILYGYVLALPYDESSHGHRAAILHAIIEYLKYFIDAILESWHSWSCLMLALFHIIRGRLEVQIQKTSSIMSNYYMGVGVCKWVDLVPVSFCCSL